MNSVIDKSNLSIHTYESPREIEQGEIADLHINDLNPVTVADLKPEISKAKVSLIYYNW